jgi:hypothetical protein
MAGTGDTAQRDAELSSHYFKGTSCLGSTGPHGYFAAKPLGSPDNVYLALRAVLALRSRQAPAGHVVDTLIPHKHNTAIGLDNWPVAWWEWRALRDANRDQVILVTSAESRRVSAALIDA